jgi:phosphoribosylaminoimidazolecarboxamide formyltransferase/IMP cyclohydrolase
LKKRVLISVFKKEGLEPLALAFVNAGYELISSGGTAAYLQSINLPVTPVETVTSNPEAFGGRMKTLSFHIESAILFDRDNPVHVMEAQNLGLVPIDWVVCNFYPFKKVFQEKLPIQEAIEWIDIGGPALVRSAAKNFKHVGVLVDPEDYPFVVEKLQHGENFSTKERLYLAAKAFQTTAKYEAEIDRYFQLQNQNEICWLRFEHGKKLRYGENPHQEGFAFQDAVSDPLSLFSFQQVAGKALSFNNFLDMHGAVNTLSLLGGEKPACVIVKHANPCGAAVADTLEEAFEKAWDGDPLAAFGGIVALNHPLSLRIAESCLFGKKFVEIFLAPSIEPEALEALTSKRKNLILMTNPFLKDPKPEEGIDLKKIRGGILMQKIDAFVPSKHDLDVVSKRAPTEKELDDLLLAWKIVRECKSNAVALVKDSQLVGAGTGQQDRLRACKLAVEKAGTRAQGACAASDAFFPFPDGPQWLIQTGVKAILHPGGSIRDDETIQLCNAHDVALLTTKGIRAFKH